jgi:hypothetical protein
MSWLSMRLSVSQANLYCVERATWLKLQMLNYQTIQPKHQAMFQRERSRPQLKNTQNSGNPNTSLQDLLGCKIGFRICTFNVNIISLFPYWNPPLGEFTRRIHSNPPSPNSHTQKGLPLRRGLMLPYCSKPWPLNKISVLSHTGQLRTRSRLWVPLCAEWNYLGITRFIRGLPLLF